MKLYALDPLLHPLDEDMLHAESLFVERFYELICQSIEPPFAISIDGLWGTGKTTIMKILQRKLQKDNYPTFWFNPWEYCQTQSVVLAFLQCLAAEHKDTLKKLKKSSRKLFSVLLLSGISAGLKIYTEGNVSLKDIKEAFKETEERQPSYENYRNSIETIKEEFAELIHSISAKHHNKPVIIFFDDLDRCLPDDAIQLLEALKNLFVTPKCQSIFICGIDTKIAKQFIKKHYRDIEEMFAINYFRKIFNLTISMPYSHDIDKLLVEHIKTFYKTLNNWNDPDNKKAEILSTMIHNLGLKAKMSSVRKYLNVINNFYVFQKFNLNYEFTPEDAFVIYLLILKEAQQPLYEMIIQEALKNEPNLQTIKEIVNKLMENEKNSQTPEQVKFLSDYVLDESLHFHRVKLYEWFSNYSTLA